MGLTKPRASQIYNLDYKQATRVVTVTNVTLSGGAPALVDGVTLSANDRVLVTGQSTGSQNGLYIVSSVGTGSNGTWVRTSDGNETGEIEAGMIVMVTEGTVYHDTQWKLITDNPIVIGTTTLTFTQNYLANSISGGTSNVTVYSNANVTISSAGTPNVLTISSTGIVVAGTVSATGNITGNYFIGNGSQLTGISISGVNANSLTGTTLAANVVNSSLTSVGTLGSLSVTGNIVGGNVSGTLITGTLDTPNQPNISTVGTLGALSVTTTVTTGNVIASGDVSATGNVRGNNLSIIYDTSVIGNVTTGNLLTGGYVSATGNVTGANLNTSGVISATGTARSGNLLTGGTVSATGNIVGGNIYTAGEISATGNITSSGNMAALNFNSTSADLAENYVADADYPPGTVVIFGGDKEITVSDKTHDTAVAGIISTAPSYLMNVGQSGECVLPVALTGRVPCFVQGPVSKGTVLVTGSTPGTAVALNASKFEPGCVVGKSLEIINSNDIVTIEVAVGRL